MGINQANTFAGQFGEATTFGNRSNGAANDRPKAQFWLNVGYIAKGAAEDGSEDYFVAIGGVGGQNNRSTLGGIALDSMSDFQLTGSANMQKLRKQQNELRNQILDAAQKLNPGESRVISTDAVTGLSLELRRVSEAADADSIETDACPVKLVI